MVGMHNSFTESWNRRLTFAFAASLILTLTPPARAGEVEGEPAVQDSVDTLYPQTAELGQSRGDPVPVPDELPRQRPSDMPVLFAQQGVIFVNFDGAQLSGGADNAADNVTQIGPLAGSFAPYGNDEGKKGAVMQAVRDDWADFNVLITDTRPQAGAYTMNMTGPTNPYGAGVLGIAPLDCNDSQTHSNITYAFHSANDGHSASTTATTIGQEVAHSYGLEHVNETTDIMNPFNAGGDPFFHDNCLPIDGGGNGILCTQQHSAQCGSGSQQNSYQELMALFGPSMPDLASPVASIVYPVDGETFAVGESFQIDVEANDDSGVQEVTLFHNGAEQGVDGSTPYGWSVDNIGEGTYELYVEAVDLAGNVSQSNVVTIYVGVDGPAPGGDDGASDGDDGSAGDDDDDDGGIDDPDGPGALPWDYGFGEDADAAGCACTSGGPSPAGLSWVLPLLLVGAAVRRRPR